MVFWLACSLGSSMAMAQGRSAAWTPGEFSGLVAGKSTRKDVIRVLGANEPKKQKRLETYTYPGKGDFSSTLIIEVDRATGVVETITVQFSPNVTRTQAQMSREPRLIRNTATTTERCSIRLPTVPTKA